MYTDAQVLIAYHMRKYLKKKKKKAEAARKRKQRLAEQKKKLPYATQKGPLGKTKSTPAKAPETNKLS